jgi:hypothetical protein
MLQRLAQGSPNQPPSFNEFQAYLSREVRTTPRTEGERDAMFRQFMLWRGQQR